MAADDAESWLSVPGEQPEVLPAARGKRQRAVDLFSPHRYRAMQVSAFERRAGKTSEPQEAPEVNRHSPDPLLDDASDPLLDSGAPAAEAALAPARGTERHDSFERLSPVEVPQGFDFPFDPNAEAYDDDSDFPHDAVEFTVTEPEARQWDESEFDVATPESADANTAQLDTYATRPFTDLEDALEQGAVESQDDAQDGLQGKANRSAGRNMPAAATVGLVLLAAAVGAAYIHKLAFAVLLYLFAIGAVIEWKRALERHGRRIPIVPLIAATVGLGVATYFGKAEGLVVALLVGCAGVVAWRIGDERIENTLADSLAGVLTLLWIPFLASFLFLLEIADDGWMRVIVVVLAVVGNDTGALAAGMRFGRHKLLPRVSPAKTWEGAIGGVLLGTLAASIAAYFFFDGEWFIGAAVGFACTIAAVIGDLAESALKRDIQVKDMSSALPGHGGILDRIDSLLFAAPVGYVVFALFLGTLGGGGL